LALAIALMMALTSMVSLSVLAEEAATVIQDGVEYRVEKDSMGEMLVPTDRYWGAQTQRSHENFLIGVGIETMPKEIIRAFGQLKLAAARANHALQPEKMTDEKLAVIEQAATEVINGELDDHFPLVVWQTGSGTQSNMNAKRSSMRCSIPSRWQAQNKLIRRFAPVIQ